MKTACRFLSLYLFIMAFVGLFTNGEIHRVIAMMLVAIFVKMWDNIDLNNKTKNQ